jgi:hypothetical protein
VVFESIAKFYSVDSLFQSALSVLSHRLIVLQGLSIDSMF